MPANPSAAPHATATGALIVALSFFTALAAGYTFGVGGPTALAAQATAPIAENQTNATTIGAGTATVKTPAAGNSTSQIVFPEVRVINVELSPDDAGERGVATHYGATFSEDIPTHAREQVESAFTFESDKPLPPGAWVWTAPHKMVYRTETFLPAHATITLRGTTALGHGSLYSADGVVYVTPGTPQTVTRIGRNLTTNIDTSTHTATVTIDGAETRTIPISAGKPGYETLAGVKATGEKYEVLRMTSASAGVAEFYDLMVPYSVRLTDHGEFIHAAPWNPQIGQANTSHGCTNMAIDDARWYYEQSLPGDPVITTGPGLPAMSRADSNGGVWNYTWPDWIAQSHSG